MVRNISAPSIKSAGRDKELTLTQRSVVRELRAKGQSIEELAVGFGVSYNTIRNVLKEAENEAPAADTGTGLEDIEAEA